MENEILNRIKEIKEQFGDSPNCYLVAILLSTRFGGEIWYDGSHCITQIDWNFYDKNGQISLKEVGNSNYIHINRYGIEIEKALVNSLIEKHKEDVHNF